MGQHNNLNYAEQKKPDTGLYTVQFHIYKILENANSADRKAGQGVAGDGKRRFQSITKRPIKTYEIVPVKHERSAGCQLYLYKTVFFF